MAAIKRRDTKPELAVRALLHASGLRYRVDLPLQTKDGGRARPDIVFPRLKLAVFIDSCFFHGCPEHGRRITIKNAGYWRPKLERNMARDRDQTAALEIAGWTVLRFWTHESPSEIATAIQGRVTQLRGV